MLIFPFVAIIDLDKKTKKRLRHSRKKRPSRARCQLFCKEAPA
jgi:hypothetical protein